jgi:hypothetical protein
LIQKYKNLWSFIIKEGHLKPFKPQLQKKFLFLQLMETVVSGIRSTGKLHLGNFYGAVKNFVQMQNEFNCYFFIADYHSLTTLLPPIFMAM